MADSIYEGGGGVTIGDAISGGSANQILFGDGSTNVAQSNDLFWDDALKIFHVGDFGLAANKTYIALDDQNSKIDLQTKGTFKAGDINGYVNSTTILLDDTVQTVSIGKLASGQTYSVWDAASHQFNTYVYTGHYIDMLHNNGVSEYIVLRGGNNVGSVFIDNIDNVVKFVNGANKRGFLVDYTNKLYKLGDIDAANNSTLFTIDDTNSTRTQTFQGKEMVVGPLNSTHAPTSDPIAMGGTFTGVTTTTYTITVNTGTTFDWTDGTNSGTNVAMDFGSPNVLSQGVTVFFVGGSYTPTEYWTQTYTATVVSRLILDYKNKSYSIGNGGNSGARARIITNGTSNAKIGTYATNYTAEISTDTSSVGFLYSDGTYSGGFGISGSQASFAISNSASDQSKLDFRPTLALLYTQDGGSGYYAGVKTTTTSVKVGDFDLIANNTLLTVDDTNSRITVSKPFGLKGYTVATLPTGFTGATAYVTDALAPTFLATIVGGGAIVTPVFYNGTNRVGF